MGYCSRLGTRRQIFGGTAFRSFPFRFQIHIALSLKVQCISGGIGMLEQSRSSTRTGKVHDTLRSKETRYTNHISKLQIVQYVTEQWITSLGAVRSM